MSGGRRLVDSTSGDVGFVLSVNFAQNLALQGLSLPISDEREKQQSVQTGVMTMEDHHAIRE
jgi:hypothetical protein